MSRAGTRTCADRHEYASERHPAQDARPDRQDARAPAWWSPRPCAGCGRRSRPASRTADLDAIAEAIDPRRRRRCRRSWATTASRRRSAPRSTSRSCTASRRRAGAARRRPHLASTAARSSTAGTATRRSPSAVGEVDPALLQHGRGRRGLDVGRHRRRGPRCGQRRAGSPTSRTRSRPRSARRGRYGIVDGYGGHGIGTEMHQDPHVLNYGRPGQGAAAGARAWRWRSSR